MTTKIERRIKIKTRIRGKISGTAERPRMTVFRSNKQIYVQLVDDLAGKNACRSLFEGVWKPLLKKSWLQKWDRKSPRKHRKPVLPRLFLTATVTCIMGE